VISNADAVDYLVGDGTAGPYAFSIDFDDTTEIGAKAQKADNSVVSLTVDTITTTTVTFTTTVESGAIIAVYRETPNTQSQAFNTFGPFWAHLHEDAFDKLTRLRQLTGANADRCLQLSPITRRFDGQLPIAKVADAAIQVNSGDTGITFLSDVQDLADAGDAVIASEASADAAAISARDTGPRTIRAAEHEEDCLAIYERILYGKQPDLAVVNVSADAETDPWKVYAVDPSGGEVDITIDQDMWQGCRVTIKNNSGYTENINIEAGGTPIDGFDSIQLRWPWQSVTIMAQQPAPFNHMIVDEFNDAAVDMYPFLEYNSTDTLDVLPKKGRGVSAISVVLQDGKRYDHMGSGLAVDFTGTGIGGLDTGSVSSDTFYYIYLVPDNDTGWRQLGAVASTSDPDSGPTGYELYRYVGAWRTDSSSNLMDIVHQGNRFFYARQVDYPRLLEITNAQPTESTWIRSDDTTETSVQYGNAVSTEIAIPSTWGGVYLCCSGQSNTNDLRLCLAMGTASAPSITPATNWADARIHSSQHNKVASTTHFYWPRDDSTGWLWFNHIRDNSNSIYVYASVAGWTDRRLPP
jgi:hypothetical protein